MNMETVIYGLTSFAVVYTLSSLFVDDYLVPWLYRRYVNRKRTRSPRRVSIESIKMDSELIRLQVLSTYLAEVGKFDIDELTGEEGKEYLSRLSAAYNKELS
jgi:hypothetical protein